MRHNIDYTNFLKESSSFMKTEMPGETSAFQDTFKAPKQLLGRGGCTNIFQNPDIAKIGLDPPSPLPQNLVLLYVHLWMGLRKKYVDPDVDMDVDGRG